MDFRTIVPVQTPDFHLTYADKLMVMGSCFAENLGKQLQECGFKATLNPFGVLYNPASVGTGLQRLWHNRLFRDDELVEYDGMYHSFSHHGSFSGTDRKKTLDHINRSFKKAAVDLRETTCLIITFGTAWVYTLPSTDQVVANCHKLPESGFLRRQLSVDEIELFYMDLLDLLFEARPDLNVLFTVSPIRHMKDGFHENTVSKAILHLAIEGLCESFDRVHYYPAFELLMDDLRDYRYYAEDMVHPSPVTLHYIWENFSDTFFQKPTKEIVHQVQQIRKAMLHRQLHPDNEFYKSFAKKNIASIEILAANVPELDLSEERAFFERILSN